MNLLYEIKLYYDKLVEFGIINNKPEFGEIERTAEKCFHNNYKDLTKHISKKLDKEKVAELNSRIDKIKEIVKNDKNNN